jgi:hypothetical protein
MLLLQRLERHVARVRRRAMTAALLTAAPLWGCYNYVPYPSGAPAPQAGEMVSLEITDQGRVGLSERFGEGVTRIEGRLRAAPSVTYDLAVFRVGYIRAETRWSGESVSVDRAFVGGVQGRAFSRSRTMVAAGTAAGTILAFIITRKLISSGQEEGEPGPPDPPDQTRLPRLQFGIR